MLRFPDLPVSLNCLVKGVTAWQETTLLLSSRVKILIKVKPYTKQLTLQTMQHIVLPFLR